MHCCPELSNYFTGLRFVGKTSPEKPFDVFGYSLPECPRDSLPVLPCQYPVVPPCSRNSFFERAHPVNHDKPTAAKFASAAELTLADVDRTIRANTELSETRKRDLLSAPLVPKLT